MNGTIASNLVDAADKLNSLAGELVTYGRADQETQWIARPASPDWEMVLDNGVVETWVGLDFVGRTSLLHFGADQIYPQRGDKITRDDGTVFQVLSPTGKQVYEISAYGESIRVHTKQVSA